MTTTYLSVDGPLERHDLENIERTVVIGGVPMSGRALREHTLSLERAACVVEGYWPKIPDPYKRVLSLFVYAQTGRVKVFDAVRGALLMARALPSAVRLFANGEGPALTGYLNARTRLQRAVLDAIERENTSFQETLSTALANLPKSAENGVSARDYMREIRALSDRAV